MSKRNTIILWVAYILVIAGIVAIVFLRLPQPAVVEPLPARTTTLATVGSEPVPPVLTPQPPATTDLSVIKAALMATLAANQVAQPTPAPLSLPDVPVPPNGQIYLLTPVAAESVGWARADDAGNHFGDYNIYAGVYEGQIHVGGVQFDLSTIPPGSPIIHADLTLTGLSDQWLGSGGHWTIEMLEPWMDEAWAETNFHWLQRLESALGALTPVLSTADLGQGQANTIFVPAHLLPLLEARLFSGLVSFRIQGPTGQEDNLFSWDSGYGSASLGRGPLLRIVAGPAPAVPPPSPTPNYVIVTPVDVIALAAEIRAAAAQATPNSGTGTPLPTPTRTPRPPHWVEPIIVTSTPTPENAATAEWLAQVQAAEEVVYGTRTPTPPWMWTATPLPPPTATPLYVPGDQLTPTPTMTPTPAAIPGFLRGKIIFYSDRTGSARLWFMDADGSNLSLWQGDDWVYERAKATEPLAPDRSRWLAVQQEQVTVPQVFILSAGGERQQLTHFEAVSYDPVWSPVGDTILFVTAASGNDEIYRIGSDGNGLQQLTQNEWEWDKHPSWSPDGQQIVFFSNRSGQDQIYIMAADGSNVHPISDGNGNDTYPVWIK